MNAPKSSSHLPVGSDELRLEIIDRIEALSAIRSAWTNLFHRAGNAAAPLHYDWIRLWLQVHGEQYMERGGLRVMCFWRGEELVGVMPLYLRRPQRLADGGTCLGFISTGEAERDEICPDYLDVLSAPGCHEACAKSAWEAICQSPKRMYDRVNLSDIAERSVLARWACDNGAAYDLEVSPRGLCPVADLSGGFDAYLGRLSANTRQQVRRLLRQAESAGARLQVASSSQDCREYFEQLIELHQARWVAQGLPGCFASASFTQFHRELVERWVPTGQALLTRLVVQDRVVGVKYGFRVGGKFDFYQSGVRHEDPALRSAGIVSFAMLMRFLADAGVTTFDFLRGSSDYKQRLSTGTAPLVSVRRVMWSWRTSVGYVAELGGKCARAAGRRIAGRRSPKRERDAAFAPSDSNATERPGERQSASSKASKAEASLSGKARSDRPAHGVASSKSDAPAPRHGVC